VVVVVVAMAVAMAVAAAKETPAKENGVRGGEEGRKNWRIVLEYLWQTMSIVLTFCTRRITM
jgi:hypothetical protein